MRFSPPDDDVVIYTTGFENDVLGRKKVSERISSIIERIEDPLVIALDGRWGTGKTFFLKRWVGAHRKENGGRATTVYFDAFANDYMGEPLIALVSALASRLPAENKGKLDHVKEVAAKIWRPAARMALALATSGATEALNNVGDAIVKAASSETEKALEQFWKKEEGRQAAFEEFRSAIEKLTIPDDDSEPIPLVIVIDELDRCRPDYALETLEIIKHFFAVPHVHFILGVNLSALENSVKARYGAEIDATSYLQKFLSFSINLPDDVGDYNLTPVTIKYVRYLGERMETPHHILNEIEEQIKYISRSNPVSIRNIGKILSSVSMISELALKNSISHSILSIIVTLILSKQLSPNLFNKFLNASVDSKEMMDFFSIKDYHIDADNKNESIEKRFDWNLRFIYEIWLFLTNNHYLIDAERSSEFKRAFYHFGIGNNFTKIPRIIAAEFLDNFKK